MKIKVKLFDEEHESDLEVVVNKFLETVEMTDFLDIKYQISSFSLNSGEQIYCYSALLVYKEK